MYKVVINFLPNEIIEYNFKQRGKHIGMYSGGLLLCNSSEFRNLCTNILKECPFEAFYWYLGVAYYDDKKDEDRSDIFKFTVKNAPSLITKANDEFKVPNSISEIPNLSRNCLLIVPKCLGEYQKYAHLGSFIRKASHSQIDQLWGTIGNRIGYVMECSEFTKFDKNIPLWISTHGNGVNWLHIRFDSSPKYLEWVPNLTKFKTKDGEEIMINFFKK